MNETLSELHKQLIQSHRNLLKQLGKTADPEDAEAILREMDEINFRVMAVGRLVFKTTTSALNKRIQKVVAAGADLDKSIAQIKKISDLLKAIGGFLTTVDKVLDAVKLR